MTIRIDSGYFIAGIVRENNHTRIAPIISYMRDWNLEKILSYCKQKHWQILIW